MIITDENDKILSADKKYLGERTNNQAEYQAVILGLERVIALSRASNLPVQCRLDSQLIVEQLNQNYKVKNEGLKPLFWQIRDLILKLGGRVTFEYIPRAENHQADKLAGQAIDESASHV